jgi:hypothetical protein
MLKIRRAEQCATALSLSRVTIPLDVNRMSRLAPVFTRRLRRRRSPWR